MIEELNLELVMRKLQTGDGYYLLVNKINEIVREVNNVKHT